MADDKIGINVTDEEKLAAGRHSQWLKSHSLHEEWKVGKDKGGAGSKDKNTTDNSLHKAKDANGKKGAGKGRSGKYKAKAQASAPKCKAKAAPKAKAGPKAKAPEHQAMWEVAQNAGDTSKSKLKGLKEQQKVLREQAKRAWMDEYNEKRRRQRIIDRCVNISDEDMMLCLQIRAEMRAERDARNAAAAAAAEEDGEGEEEEEKEDDEEEEDVGSEGERNETDEKKDGGKGGDGGENDGKVGEAVDKKDA